MIETGTGLSSEGYCPRPPATELAHFLLGAVESFQKSFIGFFRHDAANPQWRLAEDLAVGHDNEAPLLRAQFLQGVPNFVVACTHHDEATDE